MRSIIFRAKTTTSSHNLECYPTSYSRASSFYICAHQMPFLFQLLTSIGEATEGILFKNGCYDPQKFKPPQPYFSLCSQLGRTKLGIVIYKPIHKSLAVFWFSSLAGDTRNRSRALFNSLPTISFSSALEYSATPPSAKIAAFIFAFRCCIS